MGVGQNLGVSPVDLEPEFNGFDPLGVGAR